MEENASTAWCPEATMNPNVKHVSSLYRQMRIWLWQRPRLFHRWGVVNYRVDVLATDYDIWIDGYPRSGNTFAVKAFQFAQTAAVSIRHHTHLAPAIINAVMHHMPGLFLIRKPVDAIASYVIFGPVSIRSAIHLYIDFHLALLPYRSRFLTATFEEVMSDFGEVTRRMNGRFQTSFVPFQSTERDISTVMKTIEDDVRQPDGSINELRVPRPSNHRQILKRQIVAKLHSATCENDLRHATWLYEQFTASD